MAMVSIQEAAERLGIGVVAVRKRDGVWYVEIEDRQPAVPPTGSPHVHVSETETLTWLRETVTTLSEQSNVKEQQIADLIRQGERLQSLLGNEQETTQWLLSAGASAMSPNVPVRSAADAERPAQGRTASAAGSGAERGARLAGTLVGMGVGDAEG